ncbi:MAG: hypothetical protein ACLGSD_20020 [Acidobacteriota bacterium]
MNYAESLLLQAERLLDERQLAEAMQAFHRAEQHGADADRCSAGRWMAGMLLGRFESAWRESDAIRRRCAPDPHRMWNGENVDGRAVMVRCLHGFGDAVQFLRYIPLLRQRASRVTVQAAPQLVELAECMEGIDRVISWNTQERTEPDDWDVQIEVTELPYFFRTEVHDLPIATRYIHLPQAMLRSAARHFPAFDGMRVGIVWSCGEWNLSRSIPLKALRPVLAESRIEFWNLQGGPARKEWQHATRAGNLRDAPEFCADAGLLPLACFMAQLDLVITVDTLAAHLGGALGVPTWVLLRYNADWRWMVGRSDSPWYPTLRLFRQDRNRDWAEVVSRVRGELELLIAARTEEKAA